ncbi:hypothetical protein EVA_13229 [gut metagenome]|uniref:Uncharacterized protein n=1 Tax=gut metagenome TaxID=749906 RepID=J9FVX7_9ZZZZ
MAPCSLYPAMVSKLSPTYRGCSARKACNFRSMLISVSLPDGMASSNHFRNFTKATPSLIMAWWMPWISVSLRIAFS